MKAEMMIPEGLLTTHGKEVEAIFRRAVRQALLQHKKLGHSVAAWQDGKIAVIPPEQIPVAEESSELQVIRNPEDEI